MKQKQEENRLGQEGLVYHRDLKDAYMELPVREQETMPYTWRMILENTIPGYVPVEEIQKEEHRWYRWNISSWISLREYLDHTCLTEACLKQFVFMLYQAVERLGEYLLTDAFLFLTPDTVFVKVQEKDPFIGTFSFCLCPHGGQEIRRSLRELVKYMMERTDREQERCALRCYELYEMLLKDNFTLWEWMEALERWAAVCELPEPVPKKRAKQLFAGGRIGGIMKKNAGPDR